MKNSQKNQNTKNDALRARKTLQKFGYRVLKQIRALFLLLTG